MGVPLDITVRDQGGNVLGSVPVNIYELDGVTEAQVYLDSDLTVAVTQPLYTDSNGQLTTSDGEFGAYWYLGDTVFAQWFDGTEIRQRVIGTSPAGIAGPPGPAGTTTPTGLAGGDLESSYPDPTIKLLAVTEAKLADAAVTTQKLADGAVSTAKLADLGVSTAKLADLAVTSGKLADNAVTSAKINAAAVTLAKLASDATAYITAAAAAARRPPKVTSLPVSPTDGDLIRFVADAANHIYWLLQFDSTEGYWVFLGGPPLLSTIATSETRNVATYGDLTTLGPDITVPLAGDYQIQVGCQGATITTVAAFMSYAAGATPADDAWAGVAMMPNGTLVSNPRVWSGLTLSTPVLHSRYRCGSATNIAFLSRWMRVYPVRVH